MIGHTALSLTMCMTIHSEEIKDSVHDIARSQKTYKEKAKHFSQAKQIQDWKTQISEAHIDTQFHGANFNNFSRVWGITSLHCISRTQTETGIT